jgi:hypothetical protein
MSHEFWTSQWILTTAGVGSFAGGWAGAIASGALLKNPFWGAMVGSGSGGWVGQAFGNRTAQIYYDWKFGELDQQFGNWVYAQYQIR